MTELEEPYDDLLLSEELSSSVEDFYEQPDDEELDREELLINNDKDNKVYDAEDFLTILNVVLFF